MKNYLLVFVFISQFLFLSSAFSDDARCPGADAPAPVILKVDMPELIKTLEQLRDVEGRALWKTNEENKAALKVIFESTPAKTKLEQFFQLLFLLQKNIPSSEMPVVVHPPSINQVLLTAKVFTDPSFPQKITEVELKQTDPIKGPFYTVHFSNKEVRFPVNNGKGFANWEQGMCQIAKELVFYDGFSFRVRQSRVGRNLVVDNFNGVEIFGQFGSRGMFTIDLNYVDLERVEFIAGTDQGKVKARVAEREFKENKHSGFFKFIGSLIPNTSTQRIDW